MCVNVLADPVVKVRKASDASASAQLQKAKVKNPFGQRALAENNTTRQDISAQTKEDIEQIFMRLSGRTNGSSASRKEKVLLALADYADVLWSLAYLNQDSLFSIKVFSSDSFAELSVKEIPKRPDLPGVPKGINGSMRLGLKEASQPPTEGVELESMLDLARQVRYFSNEEVSYCLATGDNMKLYDFVRKMAKLPGNCDVEQVARELSEMLEGIAAQNTKVGFKFTSRSVGKAVEVRIDFEPKTPWSGWRKEYIEITLDPSSPGYFFQHSVQSVYNRSAGASEKDGASIVLSLFSIAKKLRFYDCQTPLDGIFH